MEEFFVQRLIIFLNSDYSKNVLEACASNNPCNDLCDYLQRVKAVSTLKDEKLLENANRVLRILKDEVNGTVNEDLFVEQAEKDLLKAIHGINFAGDYNVNANLLIDILETPTNEYDCENVKNMLKNFGKY